MARQTVRAGAGGSVSGSSAAAECSAAEAPSAAPQGEGAATLAAARAGASTSLPGGLGAGAAIRAARLRDCGWALDRGDLRSAVGLLLAAVRGEAG